MAETGASGSFQAFYVDEFTGVVAYLIALTGDRGVAEDLAQETFARAYRDWSTVGTYDRPGAWTRTVAHNLAMSRFRRLASEMRALARLRGMRQPDAPAMPEPDARFWAEVRRLPRRQAQAIALYYVDDRPVAEIAEIMGCAVDTAKVHLHRGRQRLGERLGLDAGHAGEAGTP